MSWPRKDDGLRLYFERKPKTYLLVNTKAMTPSDRWRYECVGEVYCQNNPDNPALASSSCDHRYLYTKCRRVAWEDMPMVWRRALRQWMTGTVKSHRGLRRMAAG